MRRKRIKLEGYAYSIGDKVEVYLRLHNNKYVKTTGEAKDAKRSYGRLTRETDSYLGI
jgi:hypothetical protein